MRVEEDRNYEDVEKMHVHTHTHTHPRGQTQTRATVHIAVLPSTLFTILSRFDSLHVDLCLFGIHFEEIVLR